MTKEKRLGIFGFGTVGTGVYEAAESHRTRIEQLAGSYTIPVVVVQDETRQRDVSSSTFVTSSVEALFASDLDTVVEAVPDAETAYPVVKRLLEAGISVVTANKELIASHGEELHYLSAVHRAPLLYEAAVGGGIPVLSSIRHALKTNELTRVEGILNGTSNYILTRMKEDDLAFNAALQEAQDLGYAEASPEKDIDGWDVYYKVTILSWWIHGRNPVWQEPPTGIRGVTAEDLALAAGLGGTIKHVGRLEGTAASAAPVLVLPDHPLSGVSGVNNGVAVHGSISGPLLFQGAGAGKFPTAGAVLEDVINLWTHTAEQEPPFLEERQEEDDDSSFPYWFITGSGLRGLPSAVSPVYQQGHREGVLVHLPENEARKLGDSCFAVLGSRIPEVVSTC
ncbi:homoserine dehydrogenase [Alkalicoccus chagannorensis]|uniref:homoserine dehydrogenase n=1 Tax=Alkalicoccus chagannorensis TaxID=427072 RepID=UPI0003F74D45|nr:homoserine dehydrogenase [Alkalicoccus chagannorensis]